MIIFFLILQDVWYVVSILGKLLSGIGEYFSICDMV